MTENYGITSATPSVPAIDLFRVPHKGKTLISAYPAFGPDFYSENQEAMSQDYSHSNEFPRISFRPATTSESISIAAYDFENLAKPPIFNQGRLQAGYVVKTQDGFFVNTKETNESKLKQMLNSCKKVNGIYLGENDLAFAPYETFEKGIQDSEIFIRGGLARALEHTNERVAENLGKITSSGFYDGGINISDFYEVSKPISVTANLYPGGGFYDKIFCFDDIVEDYYGFAFGVLDSEKDK